MPSTRIPGVDPELSKLKNFEAVVSYLNSKCKNSSTNPEDYNIEALKKSIIHYHNVYRAHHDAPALKSDMALNAAAQKWADELAHRKKCLIHEKPSEYGENLIYFGIQNLPPPKLCAVALCHGFYQEGFGYKYSTFNPAIWSEVGHFTQMIWTDSRKIGVGISIVKKDSMNCFFISVKYDPPGNIQATEEYLKNVRPHVPKRCSIQ